MYFCPKINKGNWIEDFVLIQFLVNICNLISGAFGLKERETERTLVEIVKGDVRLNNIPET